MSRRLLVCFCLMVCIAPVHAGHGASKSKHEAAEPADDALQQKRRDALRESLKSPVDDAANGPRQLSAQQKAELRQQLRQHDSQASK